MDTADPQLNIVLVEDHDVLRLLIKQALEEAGHRVAGLSCAEELEDVAGGEPADIFVIDLNLPGEDGLSLTRRLRTAYPLAGLVIMTARSRLQDKLDGYALGVDLYLTKPVEPAELCAAIAALGRRHQRVATLMQREHAQVFSLHQQNLRIGKPGHSASALSIAEAAMLTAFVRAPGQRLAYWQLAETLGLDLAVYPKSSLEVRVVRLRKKLIKAGAEPNCIESIRSLGYQLCAAVEIV